MAFYTFSQKSEELMLASQDGRTDAVQKLIKDGVDLNPQDGVSCDLTLGRRPDCLSCMPSNYGNMQVWQEHQLTKILRGREHLKPRPVQYVQELMSGEGSGGTLVQPLTTP